MIFSDAPEQILKYETSTADEIKNHAVGVVLLASLLRPPASCGPQYFIVVRVVIQISEK